MPITFKVSSVEDVTYDSLMIGIAAKSSTNKKMFNMTVIIIQDLFNEFLVVSVVALTFK
jgi:hypothetical protein